MSVASIDLAALLAEARRLGGASALPPVERWNPSHCGDIGMEIRADGSWWHEGARIGRPPLVRLFSTILRKDPDGAIYLVTPGEKVLVRVEDAPFIAVRVDELAEPDGAALAFTTNVGDVVIADAAHPIRVETDRDGAPRPYVRVRGGLEARLSRACFYDLARLSLAEDGPNGLRLCARSRGAMFDLGAAE